MLWFVDNTKSASEFPQLVNVMVVEDKNSKLDDNLKTAVLGVTALIQKGLVGFFARQNCYQYIGFGVVLAEVCAKAALPVMNCLH